MKKDIIIGLIVGLIANAIGLFLSATYFGEGEPFMTVVKSAQAEGFLGKLISLGAILNLVVFFIFIQKKQDYRARGVLFATLIVALITFLIKF